MVGIQVLGSFETWGPEVAGMEVRAVSGQEGSWTEELYNRDSQENPGCKGKSRTRFSG